MMDKKREWYEENKFLVSGVANHVLLDLDSALRDLYDGSGDPPARIQPGLATLLLSLPKTPKAAKAHADTTSMFEVFALLLVLEAERCHVPLPAPCENVSDWLVHSFLPAYKAAFPKDF